MSEIWLNPVFLKWPSYDASGAYFDGAFTRSYELLERAGTFIQSDRSCEFDRGDCISWLKRSLNARLQLIEKSYNLSCIPNTKVKGTIELLECFGLVKPMMLKELLIIRNNIEHNDATPPSIEKCSEWLELIWYFLRSTDEIAKNLKNIVSFVCYDDHSSKDTLEIEIEFGQSPMFKVHGELSQFNYSNKVNNEWPSVKLSKKMELHISVGQQLSFNGELFIKDQHRVNLGIIGVR
jgi:hypothetical protein